MNAATWALLLSVFVACFVETVEAVTIVMAMGFTRSWRSALLGTAAALVACVLFTLAAGYALQNWLPEAALQLIIGSLLLIFGLQWVRKAIYRSAGRKATHDEDRIYREQVAAARAAGARREGIDLFAFMVSFKGVFLEGVEVIFIVLTFGLSANNVPVAAYGAAAAALVVLLIAVAARKPLSMIPENTLKYGVGLMLVSFGMFWSIQGLGIFRGSGQSLQWPGSDFAILYLLVIALLLSRALIAVFRAPVGTGAAPEPNLPAPTTGAQQ